MRQCFCPGLYPVLCNHLSSALRLCKVGTTLLLLPTHLALVHDHDMYLSAFHHLPHSDFRGLGSQWQVPKYPDVTTTDRSEATSHQAWERGHLFCCPLSYSPLQLSIPRKEGCLLIIFLSGGLYLNSVSLKGRRRKKKPYWKLSRDVLAAPINTDVDLFVLLRNLHLWPVWSFHVYLKSHLIEKDTAIRLKSESLPGSLVLPPELFLWSVLPSQTNHFHTNWILVTETQDFSSGISHPRFVPCPKKAILLCDGGSSISGWQVS